MNNTHTNNPNMSSCINRLYGMIRGINYDNIVNDKEISFLKEWITENEKYSDNPSIFNIITRLKEILKDNVIDPYERLELLHLIKYVNSSTLYEEKTLIMDILKGIISGITCDNNILIEEIDNLNIWLNKNSYLQGIYPYDKLLATVKRVLSNGMLSEDEKIELNNLFESTNKPNEEFIKSFTLVDKSFLLQGEFKFGQKNQLQEKLNQLGAIDKNCVSKNLDYLILGMADTDLWKSGTVAENLDKVRELQRAGVPIHIVTEDELFSTLSIKD